MTVHHPNRTGSLKEDMLWSRRIVIIDWSKMDSVDQEESVIGNMNRILKKLEIHGS